MGQSRPLSWAGRPVYYHEGHEDPPLALFFAFGYWVVAPELPRSLPRPIARCCSDGLHPPTSADFTWEFLCGEYHLGNMVTTDTRTYATDRHVCMKQPICELTTEHVSTVGTSDNSTAIGNQTNNGSNVPADDRQKGNGALC